MIFFFGAKIRVLVKLGEFLLGFVFLFSSAGIKAIKILVHINWGVRLFGCFTCFFPFYILVPHLAEWYVGLEMPVRVLMETVIPVLSC
uniref:Uncharacterized protein n=1 Tax=Rhizophora mucronata TaxID=61149 RepID=A0A2P2LGE6_RHIMU